MYCSISFPKPSGSPSSIRLGVAGELIDIECESLAGLFDLTSLKIGMVSCGFDFNFHDWRGSSVNETEIVSLNFELWSSIILSRLAPEYATLWSDFSFGVKIAYLEFLHSWGSRRSVSYRRLLIETSFSREVILYIGSDRSKLSCRLDLFSFWV